MTFHGISNEICQTAWNITLGSVVYAFDLEVTNKLAGTVVVSFPRTTTDAELDINFMRHVDTDHPDRDMYVRIASEKAKVSRKTGLPSRKVQQDAPFLYEEGMTKWGGSVVENGLVVAFSGVQAVFDEAIAGTMLRWIVALCQHEMTKPDGVMASESSFI